jgi:hypothetical protein
MKRIRRLPFLTTIFGVTTMAEVHFSPNPLWYTVRGYEMSPGRALSRDSCPAKTTSAKARKIDKIRHEIDF